MMEIEVKRSETIGKLAEALAKAQGQIQGAVADSENPYFKSKYADLASVWDAIRKPLSTNGLSIVQLPMPDDSNKVVLTTLLMHSSGEWISSTIVMTPVKGDPQGLGSCLSYARRYSLASICGVCQIDDDANTASEVANADIKPPEKKAPDNKPSEKKVSADAITKIDGLMTLLEIPKDSRMDYCKAATGYVGKASLMSAETADKLIEKLSADLAALENANA